MTATPITLLNCYQIARQVWPEELPTEDYTDALKLHVRAVSQRTVQVSVILEGIAIAHPYPAVEVERVWRAAEAQGVARRAR